MTPKRLYVAMPAYDGRLMASTFQSLMLFLMQGSPLLSQPPFIDIMPGESHVNRVRNRLAKRFLNTDCTHMLFIDSDIAFSANHITALLKRDLPIIGGMYSKKDIGEPQWVVNAIEGIEKPDEDGLIEVKYVGSGFMLIAREVFETLIHSYPIPFDIFYDDDSDQKMGRCCNFFHAGVWPETTRWLSEDWWFCESARAAGFKIHADTKCTLAHVGIANYPIGQCL